MFGVCQITSVSQMKSWIAEHITTFKMLLHYFSVSCPFYIAEEPSICYYYDGDGVCEDFERETGVRDCGLYTPSGYLDQWASSVEVSHEERPYCSGEVAAGYPAVTKVSPLILL